MSVHLVIRSVIPRPGSEDWLVLRHSGWYSPDSSSGMGFILIFVHFQRGSAYWATQPRLSFFSQESESVALKTFGTRFGLSWRKCFPEVCWITSLHSLNVLTYFPLLEWAADGNTKYGHLKLEGWTPDKSNSGNKQLLHIFISECDQSHPLINAQIRWSTA